MTMHFETLESALKKNLLRPIETLEIPSTRIETAGAKLHTVGYFAAALEALAHAA